MQKKKRFVNGSTKDIVWNHNKLCRVFKTFGQRHIPQINDDLPRDANYFETGMLCTAAKH